MEINLIVFFFGFCVLNLFFFFFQFTQNETEWQQYLRQCIETLCLIAEDRPFQVFEQVYSDWQRPFEMFMSLEKSHDGSALTITDYPRCHLIHCVTRDLASLCQTLTSLIPTLNG